MGQKVNTNVNDREPNFYSNGKLYLVRCYACEPEHGRENYTPSVSSGTCAWCGWRADEAEGA